jgi:hypothetical protein
MAVPKKPRICRACKQMFQPCRPLQTVCGPACAIEQAKFKRVKEERIVEKEARKVVKQNLEKLKTRSQWMREAQTEFNKFIRARDKLAGFDCISSGRSLDWSGNNVDAGHYRSTGSAPHLRFDERNCHAQSKHDNRYLAGNAVDYRIGLIARIGLVKVEELEADQTPRNYTIEDLKAIKAIYIQKRKELSGGN